MLVDLVQTTTRDGVRLDGILQAAARPSTLDVDTCCLVHGTGGHFYGSTLFDALADWLLERGCGVLRINTRGHDIISNAVTAKGGRRLGAAYALVDDCRHDLASWVDWLRQQVGPRVGLIGHSLGAVKCVHALAHEPQLGVQRLLAVSPPRLSYGWFCSSPEGADFLHGYAQAERLIEQGQPTALLEVRLPLPMVITAVGYLEKYGPAERYNYLKLIASVKAPILVTLGEIEAANNMAFRGAAEELTELGRRYRQIQVAVVPGADHFYTGVRPALVAEMERWLHVSRET